MGQLQIVDNKVRFPNGIAIIFNGKIGSHLLIDNLLILLIAYPPKNQNLGDKAVFSDNQNIHCYDLYGSLVWKINYDEHHDQECPYVDLLYNQDRDVLVVFNWCDYRCDLNYRTGELINRYPTK